MLTIVEDFAVHHFTCEPSHLVGREFFLLTTKKSERVLFDGQRGKEVNDVPSTPLPT